MVPRTPLPGPMVTVFSYFGKAGIFRADEQFAAGDSSDGRQRATFREQETLITAAMYRVSVESATVS
jgi:hypothetical protein